jgi:hypothetical protein
VTGTVAVPLDWLKRAYPAVGDLTGQPLCPGCDGGYLHPYRVDINLAGPDGPWLDGVTRLTGWVAVCAGSRDRVAVLTRLYEQAGTTPDGGELDVTPPCGFALPMQPQQRVLG